MRTLTNKKEVCEYLIRERPHKTLRTLSIELGVCEERVRQLCIDAQAFKPRRDLAWFRAEVKRLTLELEKYTKSQHDVVANMELKR